MKWLMILALFPGAALAADGPPIVGNWVFYEKIYQGQEIPEGPDSKLRLHFDFTAEGRSHLYWWHEGDNDHCSRLATYELRGDTLVEKITSIDPNNTPDCDSDPDMQMPPEGKVSTLVSFKGADLVIHFHLNTDDLDYVWRKTSPSARGDGT